MKFTLGLAFFLDLLGYAVVFAVFYELFLSHQGWVAQLFGCTERTLLLGAIFVVYALLQLIGGLFFSSLFASAGNRKAVSLALLLACASLLITGAGLYYQQLPLLFLGRALGGFTSGNSALMALSLGSVSLPWTLIAGALGTSLGPLLSGVMADEKLLEWFHDALPFWALAGLTLFALFLWLVFAPKKIQLAPAALGPGRAFYIISTNLRTSPHKRRTFSLLAFWVGWFLFVQYISSILFLRFSFSEHQIGISFFGMGLLWTFFLWQFGRFHINEPLGAIRHVRASLFVASLSVGSSTLFETPWLFAIAVAVFLAATAFVWTHMGAFFAQAIGDDSTDETSQLYRALSMPATFIGTLLGAGLLLANSWSILVAVASCLLLSSVFLTALPNRD